MLSYAKLYLYKRPTNPEFVGILRVTRQQVYERKLTTQKQQVNKSG